MVYSWYSIAESGIGLGSDFNNRKYVALKIEATTESLMFDLTL